MAKLTIEVDLEKYRYTMDDGFFAGDIKEDIDRALDEALYAGYDFKKVQVSVTRYGEEAGIIKLDRS